MNIFENNSVNVDEAKKKFQDYEKRKEQEMTQQYAGANQNNGTANNTDDEAISFVFEKQQFKGTQETDMITTQEFGKKLANEFGKVFSDFAGCIIVPGPKGEPSLIMYFKDSHPKQGMIKAIRPFKDNINMNDGMSQSAADLIAVTSTFKSRRYYDLTKEAKQSLKRYMQRDGNGNINWNQKITETSASGLPNGPILVQIQGFNLIEIIKAIYGYKYKVKVGDNSQTRRYEYGVQILSPVKNPYQNIQMINGIQQPSAPTNYVMTITRLDSTKVNERAMLFGQPTAVGTIAMCVPDLT